MISCDVICCDSVWFGLVGAAGCVYLPTTTPAVDYLVDGDRVALARTHSLEIYIPRYSIVYGLLTSRPKVS
jgi:hypothetical protein